MQLQLSNHLEWPEEGHLRLLFRLLNEADDRDRLPSSSGGKGQGKATPGTGLQNEANIQALSRELHRAISEKNWAAVNALIRSPREVWMLACSEQGSRELQKLLKGSSDNTEQAAFKSAVDKVICGLQTHVLEATASNGSWNYSNYVLQALIEELPVERFTFILEEMKSQVVNVALDPQGCRVLQRLLEHVLDQEQHGKLLMSELTPAIKRVAADRYGNHVMQKLVEMATVHQKMELTKAFLALARQPGQLRELAMNPYSSFVLEKVIREFALTSNEQQQLLAAVERELEGVAPQSGRKAKKSEYGSFVHRTVVQKKKTGGSPKEVCFEVQWPNMWPCATVVRPPSQPSQAMGWPQWPAQHVWIPCHNFSWAVPLPMPPDAGAGNPYWSPVSPAAPGCIGPRGP